MSTLTFLLNLELPRLSYARAIDIYTGLSITYCFATLLVTFTVHYLGKDELVEKPKEINADIEQVSDILCRCMYNLILILVFFSAYLERYNRS